MKARVFILLLICFIFCGSFSVAEGSTLRIGYWDVRSETVQGFLKRHQDITATSGNMNARTTDDLISSFLTEEFDYDVFPLFTVQYDISPLMEKGYLVDLSQSEEILDRVHKMREDVAGLVTGENGIYALPYGLLINYMTWQEQAWKDAGFIEEDVPTTFDEFLNFLENWCSNRKQGFCIFSQFDETLYTESRYAECLLNMLFENYMMQNSYAGELVTFDDPRLIERMERCREIGRKLYQLEPIPNQGMPLFSIDSSSVTDIHRLISLRMNQDQPRLIKAYLWTVAVNASSSVQDTAIEFAKYILHENDFLSALLYKEPHAIENPYFDETAAVLEKTVSDVKEKLKNDSLSAQAKVKLQGELEEAQNELNEYMVPENEFLLTEEQITDFLTQVDGLYIETPGPLSVGSENGKLLTQWISSYASGLTSAQQMIQKLNEISWMIQMEGM